MASTPGVRDKDDDDDDRARDQAGDAQVAGNGNTADKCLRRMVAYLHASAGKKQLLADSSVSYTFDAHAPTASNDSMDMDTWKCSAVVCSQHYSQRQWACGQYDVAENRFAISIPLAFKSTQQILSEGHAELAAGRASRLQVSRHNLRWHPSSFTGAAVIETTEVADLAVACKCTGRRKRRRKKPPDDDDSEAGGPDGDNDGDDASDSAEDSDASILEALARELDKGNTNYSDEEELESGGKDDKDPRDVEKIDELSHAVTQASSKYKTREEASRGDHGGRGGAQASASAPTAVGSATASYPRRSTYLCPVVPSSTSSGSGAKSNSSREPNQPPDTRVFRPRSEDPQIDAITSVDSIQSKLTSRHLKEAVRTVAPSRRSSDVTPLPGSVPGDGSGEVGSSSSSSSTSTSAAAAAIPEEVMVASLKQAQASNAGLLFVEEVAEEGLLGLASFPPSLPASAPNDAAQEQPQGPAHDLSLAEKERNKCFGQIKLWSKQLLETALAFNEFTGLFFPDWRSLGSGSEMYRRISLVLFLDESDAGEPNSN